MLNQSITITKQYLELFNGVQTNEFVEKNYYS